MSHKKLTREEIAAIADLIKIFIPEDEMDDYADQLDTALDCTEVFDELDTNDIPITSSSIGLINVFRDDSSQVNLSQDQATSNAHSTHNGYIVVQRVVRK